MEAEKPWNNLVIKVHLGISGRVPEFQACSLDSELVPEVGEQCSVLSLSM